MQKQPGHLPHQSSAAALAGGARGRDHITEPAQCHGAKSNWLHIIQFAGCSAHQAHRVPTQGVLQEAQISAQLTVHQ